MPTPEQIQELISNTTTAWTASDGVSGMTFTSKSDTSKSIYIPAAGKALNGKVLGSGSYGGVWSSMLTTSSIYNGQDLYVNSGGANLDNSEGFRHEGFSVRGVIG